jgi:solute:Na+ symporter, SSS family
MTVPEILQKTNFSTIDWVIVILYPLISVGIGLYVRKYVRNMKDFVVAGRGMGLWLGIATITGTELGLITVMYSSQKGFTGGFAAFHIALAAGIVTFVVGVTGFLVYRLRKLEVMTIPEFYEKRFDRKTRILGGIMMALGGILNMGLFLKVGSMFLVGITGLSASSWALPAVMVFLIVLVLIYTCLGGMISVVIADYVQFVVLSIGLLLACYLAVNNLGWTNIVDTVKLEMGKGGIDPTVEGSGFGVQYMIWMGFLGLVSCGIWPTSVARALAMKSPKIVKRQFMLSSVSYMIRFLIPYFWGICAFVFIMQDTELKDLFFPGDGSKGYDNLYSMPIFLGRILPAGLIGIITAGMVAAFMSTHDSYLLCWSSVLTQDVVAPISQSLGKEISAKGRVTLSRIFIVVIGLYVLYWGLIYDGGDDIWDYMAVTGAIYFSGAFALLLCGLYWKRASSTGAFLALITGIVAIAGLGPVQGWINDLIGRIAIMLNLTPPEAVKWPSETVGLCSIGATTLVMIIGSLLFPDRKKDQPVTETATEGAV